MDKEKKEYKEPLQKEIFSIEYSVPKGMSNEEVLWFLHLIAKDIELEDKELETKQLKLVLYETQFELEE